MKTTLTPWEILKDSKFIEEVDDLSNKALRSLKKQMGHDILHRFERKEINTTLDLDYCQEFREYIPQLTSEKAQAKALRVIAQFEYVEQLYESRNYHDRKNFFYQHGEAPIDPKGNIRELSVSDKWGKPQ